ncbi:MAG: DUF302 domain-containing protein [Firmicutes bacterium]|nr:DUF302 domain-containing protein [Bacillota bacterium]MCL5039274.1 DUF302 domain-containing protein [Bacillota bacterium]
MSLLFDDYTTISAKPFGEAVKAVKTKAQSYGFTILAVHDLQAIFGAKGFGNEPVTLVEICNEPFGSQMLKFDPQMSLMMPCKIAVYVKGGQTHISALRPRMIGELMPELAAMAAEGDKVMCQIVDEAR